MGGRLLRVRAEHHRYAARDAGGDRRRRRARHARDLAVARPGARRIGLRPNWLVARRRVDRVESPICTKTGLLPIIACRSGSRSGLMPGDRGWPLGALTSGCLRRSGRRTTGYSVPVRGRSRASPSPSAPASFHVPCSRGRSTSFSSNSSVSVRTMVSRPTGPERVRSWPSRVPVRVHEVGRGAGTQGVEGAALPSRRRADRTPSRSQSQGSRPLVLGLLLLLVRTSSPSSSSSSSSSDSGAAGCTCSWPPRTHATSWRSRRPGRGSRGPGSRPGCGGHVPDEEHAGRVGQHHRRGLVPRRL